MTTGADRLPPRGLRGLLVLRWQHREWLSNTYLLGLPGGRGLVVDPGNSPGPILEAARAHRLRIERIFLTHHHLDHSLHALELRKASGARIAIHRSEAPLLRGPLLADDLLDDGQESGTADLSAEVIHIPGHTAGQAALHVPGLGVFTGDTLFRRSVGSTVAPGHTDFPDLRRSLLDRLLSLPDDTAVLAGHAGTTTIGEERLENPFLRVMRGIDRPGNHPAVFDRRRVKVLVWAKDYDGGHKAWVRFEDDGTDAVVPGSRVSGIAVDQGRSGGGAGGGDEGG